VGLDKLHPSFVLFTLDERRPVQRKVMKVIRIVKTLLRKELRRDLLQVRLFLTAQMAETVLGLASRASAVIWQIAYVW
jgi:hypothetical protein